MPEPVYYIYSAGFFNVYRSAVNGVKSRLVVSILAENKTQKYRKNGIVAEFLARDEKQHYKAVTKSIGEVWIC